MQEGAQMAAFVYSKGTTVEANSEPWMMSMDGYKGYITVAIYDQDYRSTRPRALRLLRDPCRRNVELRRKGMLHTSLHDVSLMYDTNKLLSENAYCGTALATSEKTWMKSPRSVT